MEHKCSCLQALWILCLYSRLIDEGTTKNQYLVRTKIQIRKTNPKSQLNQSSGLIESKELKPNVPNPVKDLKICTY